MGVRMESDWFGVSETEDDEAVVFVVVGDAEDPLDNIVELADMGSFSSTDLLFVFVVELNK